MVNMKLPVLYSKLTPKERKQVREEYIKQQNGLCYYCKKDLNTPPLEVLRLNHQLYPENFFLYPIHLHHDHITDRTIGAVHAYCNAVLFEYEGE